MTPYVHPDSIVRKIWGKSDTILFIFAGSAAEFALNKAVDWLYFTGRLPTDPIGRLFSTVTYSRKIIFSTTEAAEKAIDSITAIHSGVEKARGASIPDWAYRDVLFMLIHYSIASYELLERKLTGDEKEAVYDVFHRVGQRMQLKDLPLTYGQWLPVRESHMNDDLAYSHYTKDLFVQYKKALGAVRYTFLKEAQQLLVPPRIATLLRFKKSYWLRIALRLYKISRWLKLDSAIKATLLPGAYHAQINSLDKMPQTLPAS